MLVVLFRSWVDLLCSSFHILFVTSMSLLRFSIFSFVSREFIIDFWTVLRRLLSNPCQMIPAFDHLGVWHQLNVFAHLNCNCLGSWCDG